MKWYKRDPDAALVGMIGLTLEERGAYNTLLDLLYSRDGDVPDDDSWMARHLQCRPQVWRRLKRSLMDKGKVRETGGKLTANRVETTLISAHELMDKMAHLGRVSGEKRKQNNGAAQRPRSTAPDGKTTSTTTVEVETPSKRGVSTSTEYVDRAPPAGDAPLANGSRRPNGGSPDPNDRLLSDDEFMALPLDQRKAYYRDVLSKLPPPLEDSQ